MQIGINLESKKNNRKTGEVLGFLVVVVVSITFG